MNAIIDRNKIRKLDILCAQGGITAEDVYKQYKPDYLINLGQYDTKTGTNIVIMEDENMRSGYLFALEGIGIKGEKELVWVTNQKAYECDEIRDYISGAPVLVKNKTVAVDWGNKYSEYIDKSHIRSFIGFNDNSLVLCATEKIIPINDLAWLALNMGCDYAINLDGGGSSHLQIDDKIQVKSTRANASWLLVYMWEGDVKTNLKLVEFVKDAWQEQWGYVWGTWGLYLTEKILQQKIAQYPDIVGAHESFIRQKWMNKRTVDCGGLIKAFLWWQTDAPIYNSSTDISADAAYQKSIKKGTIGTMPDIPGLCVWRKGHIGVYIGNNEVIEAKGTKFGVIKSPLTGLESNKWTHWLQHPYVEYVMESEEIFADVAKERWSYEDILAVYKLGLMGGYPDKTFRPTGTVTREEMAVILNRLRQLK